MLKILENAKLSSSLLLLLLLLLLKFLASLWWSYALSITTIIILYLQRERAEKKVNGNNSVLNAQIFLPVYLDLWLPQLCGLGRQSVVPVQRDPMVQGSADQTSNRARYCV